MSEHSPCPICTAPRRITVPFDQIDTVEALRAARGDREPYGWYLCESCGNAAPSRQPRLEILEAYWDTNKVDADSAKDAADWAYRTRIAEIGAARSLAAFGTLSGGRPGRFLDIACGLGVTVKRFEEAGWEAMGIDTDAVLEDWHRKLGITAQIGSIETVTFNQRFDLIQVAYAIYFITEPMLFLKRLHSLLTPGGHVGIVLADLLAYTAPGGPSYLHSWLPTIEGLEQALARSGFRVVRRERIKDSWFVTATPGNWTAPPPPVRTILWRHRTRALRYALLGRGRAWTAGVVKRLLGR